MQVIIDSVANKQTLGRIGAGGLLDVSYCCDVFVQCGSVVLLAIVVDGIS